MGRYGWKNKIGHHKGDTKIITKEEGLRRISLMMIKPLRINSEAVFLFAVDKIYKNITKNK